MRNHEMRPIVVGVSHSASANAALEWGAAEAARQRRPLELLYAYQATPLAHLLLEPTTAVDPATSASALLAQSLTTARLLSPEITVHGSIVEDDAIEALVEASERAAMLVVGSRLHLLFGQLWRPSIGSAVAARAGCPVAIVPDQPRTMNGPVVVGLEESPAGESALELAFHEAEVWRCGVLAIHACGPADHRAEPVCQEASEAAVRRLTPFVDQWTSKYPDVDVDFRVLGGSAADVLTAAAGNARMTVLGPSQNAQSMGPTLGSVGQHLLHCAVGVLLVAPSPPSR